MSRVGVEGSSGRRRSVSWWRSPAVVPLFVLTLLASLAMVSSVPAPAVAGGPWYVAPAGDDANDCLSPATACATIGTAVANAISGDTVLVAIGDYAEEDIRDDLGYVTPARVLVDRNLTLSGGWDPSFGTRVGLSTLRATRLTVLEGVVATVDRFEVTNANPGIINSGDLTVTMSDVHGNDDGISTGGSLTLARSTVRDNGMDGGIRVWAGTAQIADSTISGNRDFGGIKVLGEATSATIVNSTISGNEHVGIGNWGALSLVNSAVVDNRDPGAPDEGGGVQNRGSASVHNTIIARNTNSDGGDANWLGNPAAVSSFNLIGGDPRLSALRDNGGPTWTHALLEGSPAIDAGNPAAPGSGDTACQATDQRGVARPQGTRCDIGALEARPENSAPVDDWTQYCLWDQMPVRVRSTWRANEVTLDGVATDAAEWSEAEEWFFPLQLFWDAPDRYRPCESYMRVWLMNDDTHLYGRYFVRWGGPFSDDDGAGIAMFRGGPQYGVDSDFGLIPASTAGMTTAPWDAYNPDVDNTTEWWFGDEDTATGTMDMEGAGSRDEHGYWFEWRKPLDSGDGYDWALEPGDVVGGSTTFMANLWDDSEQRSYEHFFRLTLAAGPPSALPAVESLVPARVLETRSGWGMDTVDGLFEGIGRRAARSTLQLTVAGRGGVPADAEAVMLNVTAVSPSGPGFLTVFPCGARRPLASNLNFVAGDVIANAVLVRVGTGGRVCIYTHAATDLVVDVNGYVPAGGSPASVVPARVLETRSGPGLDTIDGRFEGIGQRAARSTLQLTVAGRGGVPADAEAVMLNVTAVSPLGPGFLTVYPCGAPRPWASNVNYVTGDIVPNAVLAKIGTDGKVCVYTHAATHLVIDVNGYVPADASPVSIEPTRLVETRPDLWTIDSRYEQIGPGPARSTLCFTVAGRGGVPVGADAVMLNVTAVAPSGPGFLTVYPSGAPRPWASNVNYTAGDVVPNAVLAQLGDHGQVCVYTHAATHLVIDVNGYVP